MKQTFVELNYFIDSAVHTVCNIRVVLSDV
jgi:hypothetical protein